MTATTINERFSLEPNRLLGEGYWNIIDQYTMRRVGSFDNCLGAWVFHLSDGRSRFGGYSPVCKSLRLMLKVGSKSLPEWAP